MGSTAMKIPSVDRTECTDCEICLEMAPMVFRRNDSGLIEVVDLPEYPEEEVDEVIKNCPCDCIAWDET
jgi:ferredoxin